MTTANGVQVSSRTLHWAKSGTWRMDLLLAEGAKAPVVGSSMNVKSDSGFAMVGKVLRSGLDATDRPHAVVIGGLGWQSLVKAPLSFQSDGGVKLSTVLDAINGYARETIVKPADRTIGSYYECVASREGEPVRWADVLNDLTRNGLCPPWRVDPDGVTRFGDRVPVTVTDRATLMIADRAHGTATYGIDDPAQFIPGNIVDGATIERIDLRESDGKHEVDVHTSESIPSIRDMVRRMVAHELGDRSRTYTVAACHADGRCDLSPPPDAPHLPEMLNVEQWITGGVTFNAPPGSQAIVGFRDSQKTRPVIIGFQRADGTAFPPVARQGDLVQSGGLLQMINFAGVDYAPLVLWDMTKMLPIPGPYFVSFAAFPGPLPPTPAMQGPLYGAVSSGTALLGAKT